MITLEQARTIVEQGDVLLADLNYLDQYISAFRKVPGDMVMCRAFSVAPGTPSDYGRFGGSASVELLPVPKAQAISALLRERTKMVAKLAELGVEAPQLPPDGNDTDAESTSSLIARFSRREA